MTDNSEVTDKGRFRRRSVLRGIGTVAALGVTGLPAVSGRAAAAEGDSIGTLYLTDSGLEGNDDDGTKLFEVELDDDTSEANLRLLAELDAETGGNDWYDQVDAIAATPDGETVYAVDKRSKHLGEYDVDSGEFSDQGVIGGLPNKEKVVLASYAPDDTFYAASDTSNAIMYVLDPTVPEVTESIDFPKNFFRGADIAFSADGTLYIFSNSGDTKNGAGLYKVDEISSASEPVEPEFIGQPADPFFTGLAVREAGSGALVGSTHAYDPSSKELVFSTDDNVVSNIFTLGRADGSKIANYTTKQDGGEYIVGYGDMTSGRLCEVCSSGESLLVKYEWDGEEFVVEKGSDDDIEKTDVTLDDDGEPTEACFTTEYCAVDAVVKAGNSYKTVTVNGDFCLTGIEEENPAGKTVTRAISNIQFYCDAPDDPSVGNGKGDDEGGNGGNSNSSGNGNGNSSGNGNGNSSGNGNGN